MFIKISPQATSSKELVLKTKDAQLHVDIQVEKTEYLIETEQFVFVLDTNICKNKRAELAQQLNTISVANLHQISAILYGNYFMFCIHKPTLDMRLMRDVCGVKTAYFSITNTEVIIGSVMHQVARASQQKSFDAVGVEQLICSGYLLDGQTLYKGCLLYTSPSPRDS